MIFSQSGERKAQSTKTFHQILEQRIDTFVDIVYEITRSFPPYELYGVTSQLRRAALSIPLNYHEGYGRFLDKAKVQFNRVSFGSLKESLYLIDFAHRQKYITEQKRSEVRDVGMKIYGMFWGILKS
jgi:four helix bundle protein